MTTTEKPPAGHTPLLSADDVAAYRRDGFFVARGILDSEVLDAADRGMARFYDGDHDAPFPGRTQWDHTDWTPAAGDVLRKNDYASRMVRELDTLVRAPAIAAIAAQLAGRRRSASGTTSCSTSRPASKTSPPTSAGTPTASTG
jgi:hypothetical protein